MITDKLTQLLNAFYEGTISIEQEQELYAYFTSENVPEELIDEKRVFLSLYNLSDLENDEVSASLNNKLSSLIDGLSSKERPRRRNIVVMRISAVAASLLILISVGLFVMNSKQHQSILVDTFTDPQEAYAEAQKALEMVSATLNTSLDPLKKASSNISDVNQLINESLGKIQ